MKRFLFLHPHLLLLRAPADDGTAAGAAAGAGGGGAADPAAAAAAAAAAGAGAGGAGAPAAKWFETDGYTAEDRDWLAAKGFALDDPVAALAKISKSARGAEKLLGKGPEGLLERPAKDQALTDWIKANAGALGLPDKAEAYAAKPPEGWPKDLTWNGDLEGAARTVAFDNGVPPKVHQAYVDLFAREMMRIDTEARSKFEAANTAMLADLTRQFGDKVALVEARARQGAQFVAEKAGLDGAAIEHISTMLSMKTGDAATIKFMAKIGELLGEDTGISVGRSGGGLGMSAQDARAEAARLRSRDGEYAKAVAAGDRVALTRLKPHLDTLDRIAAGG